jgi:hypothetical protein
MRYGTGRLRNVARASEPARRLQICRPAGKDRPRLYALTTWSYISPRHAEGPPKRAIRDT